MPRILIFSNAAHVPTGYGEQNRLLTGQLICDGWETITRANYGLRGAAITNNGGLTLPASYTKYGEDIMIADIQTLKPDVSLLLFDIWVFPDDILEQKTLVGYVPIDHNPISPLVAEKCKKVQHLWAMSRFADRQMRSVGCDPWYAPHMTDTSIYKPVERTKARNELEYPDDWFVAVTVAANKSYPSRKNLDKMFHAWSIFVQSHPKSVLYVHSQPRSINGGFNLKSMARHFGIPEINISFADTYKLASAQYPPTTLNLEYNAADVYLQPSAGEGFGVPVIEAQAAGCPVIVSDWTAQSELCGAGWLIPVSDDDRQYTLQGSFWANVPASKIVTALEKAHDARGNDNLRKQAREFAIQYDVSQVYKKYMKPSLDSIVEMNRSAA